MASTDRIERSIVLPVSREEAWDALTQPEQLAGWFASQVELDLRPGGAGRFDLDDEDIAEAVVESVEPPRRFAFRWWRTPRDSEEPSPAGSTLVEFTLDETAEGTRLTLVESGFAILPPAYRHPLLAIRQRRWDRDIKGFAAYLDALVEA